ncbi:MAG: hypothetical protein LIR25_04400 [bacterium]|nr:hypothetical protein [bacterium]
MCNPDSLFTMHAEPVPVNLDSFDMSDFHLLMGCGSIDLANPTLNVLGLVTPGSPYEADILLLELSPFSQHLAVVGKAALGDLPTFGVDLLPLFALMGSACPSLLLSPTMLPPLIVEKLYHLYFRSRNDGKRLLEGVRLYPRDPFKRVSRNRLARQKACGPLEDRKLESFEARELASSLLKPKASDMEWKGFILAWDDAAKTALAADPCADVMNLDELLSLYDKIQPTCRLEWKRHIRKSCGRNSPHPV